MSRHGDTDLPSSVLLAVAKLSRARAECARELRVVSQTDDLNLSEAWASAGIAAVVRLCQDPATAEDAAATLANLSAGGDASLDDLIREAGAVRPLVEMLRTTTTAAYSAAVALANLASSNAFNGCAIAEAGAIPRLVALLSDRPSFRVAAEAAAVLSALAFNPLNERRRRLIIEAGAVPRLVVLLSAHLGSVWSDAAATAAAALHRLAIDEGAIAAIIEAGAIPPLLALLSGGPTWEAAAEAAGALTKLTSGDDTAGANTALLLEEVARTRTDCSTWEILRGKLHRCASAQLQAAGEGTDVAALAHASTLAAAAQVDAAVVAHAQARQREKLDGEMERQERRESFGLGTLALPDEFLCPITMDKMRGVPPPHPPPTSPGRRRLSLHHLHRRPGGGVRRPLVRAVGHPLGAPRGQRCEPAHPRAAPDDDLPKPRPEAAHAGARGGLAARGGHRRGER